MEQAFKCRICTAEIAAPKMDGTKEICEKCGAVAGWFTFFNLDEAINDARMTRFKEPTLIILADPPEQEGGLYFAIFIGMITAGKKVGPARVRKLMYPGAG